MASKSLKWMLCLAALAAATAPAQAPAEPASAPKPRVYALIAAVGSQITVVTDVSHTGSRLPPYRHSTKDVPDNALNRFTLHTLDESVAKMDADSTRIHLSLNASDMDRVVPADRESYALKAVIAEVEKLPQRTQWDRIVVATPAYRALDRDGMGSRIQGYGVMVQPKCQAGCASPGLTLPTDLDAEPPGGWPAVTKDNETIKARTYVAPFSYISVWVLDPKTLAVIDREESMAQIKLAERRSKPALDLTLAEDQQYLAQRLTGVIEQSVGNAVAQSAVDARVGRVEPGEVRVIKPDEQKR